MPRAVVTLGITQIIGWGTTVYALGVLAKPIAADTGWRLDLVIGGITLALLASGLVSTTVGRLLDHRGGQAVMVLGSVATAGLLAAIAWAPNLPTYLIAWALLGIAMRMSLYDAAFTALVQVTPVRGRLAISYLTLFGSFASSIFWPIGHALAEPFGWRGTFLIFAGLNLLICVPLHWWGLRAREPSAAETATPTAAAATQASPVLDGTPRRIAMALFAIVTSACAFVFGALAILLPAVLEASGVSAREAVILASIKGVAQFAGRVCDIRYGKNLGVLTVGRIAVACLPLSFAALMLGSGGFHWALAFTILFGISNGLLTIVRGAVPLVLFGPVGYGAVLGLLATPYLLMNASAPVLLAALIERTNFEVGEAVLFGAGLVALAAMEIMAAWYRRLQSLRKNMCKP
jgi:predicted MFS family arabinose efflux permease